MPKRLGQELNPHWRFDFDGCHFDELQPDGSLLMRMRLLGDMDDTAVVCWLPLQTGQVVQAGQALAEFDCCKLTAELLSPCQAHVVQVLVSLYQKVPVGEPLWVLLPIT